MRRILMILGAGVVAWLVLQVVNLAWFLMAWQRAQGL